MSVFSNTPQPAPAADISNMFANMNVSSTQPQGFGTATTSWSSWGTASTQPGAPVSNITNTVNLFGDMNINQPVTQSKQDSHATATFNLFEGMTQKTATVNSAFAAPASNDDGFGDFVGGSSGPAPAAVPPKPKADDPWAMGGGLFNLSSLKKDSEKKDKLHYGDHASPEKNLLHTKGEDLNKLWSSAGTSHTSGYGHSTGYSGASTGYGITPPTTFPTYNQNYSTGYGGATGFPSTASSGFPAASGSVFGGYNAPSSGFPATGFGGASTFPQTNAAWPSSTGFPTQTNQAYAGGGFGQYPSSSSGFPQSNNSTGFF